MCFKQNYMQTEKINWTLYTELMAGFKGSWKDKDFQLIMRYEINMRELVVITEMLTKLYH